MPCFHPIPAVQAKPGDKLKFGNKFGVANLKIPCGKCIGCRNAKAAEWGNRCEHEARNWKHNTFVTLTYENTTLPYNGHLQPKELQNFIKRLRIYITRKGDNILTEPRGGIRYFACGEYGASRDRPHYHLILFNCDFADKVQHGGTPDKPRYNSKTLEHIWGLGLTDIGNFTPAAATYIGKYTNKSLHTKFDEEDGYADEYGEWHARPRPFGRMSTKPPIGTEWLKKYANDLLRGALYNSKGQTVKIPRAYMTRLKKEDSDLHARIQYYQQEQQLRTPAENRTQERLEAAERIAQQNHQRTEERRKL